jgi:phosphoribosylaminoimidazole carboxylase (NCAIR synthetase)
MAFLEKMGFYSFVRDERVVFSGLIVATISAIAVMKMVLEYSRDEAEIKPTQPKTQYITQDTEDSLKQSTLESLLAHHNYSIRETALRIVASRVANNKDAIDELLWGITRPDYAERAKCLKALQFVVEDGELPAKLMSTRRH